MTGPEWIALAIITAAQPASIVEVDRDNVRILHSCSVNITEPFIEDTDGNGVIHIAGSNITVSLAGQHLRGARADQLPDTYSGIGIRVTGNNVTLIDARVSGYKVGIHAVDVGGFTLNGANVSDNFRQRLRSTPVAEDVADWLSPHENDANEWVANYGAGICIENCSGGTVHNTLARDVQNGIILDGCEQIRIYDNDCSFLSGWGLALWRSSNNIISRNAFDFCVRGYSHSVYNRGQDSAGILLFEQCSGNLLFENSCTHCGDGVFGFAGREALGQDGRERDPNWYRFRGNTRNLIVGNDLSHNVAHGVEMTFSMGNWIRYNLIVGNAICGVWAGYSRHTRIYENLIEDNGDMPSGDERGGINIEHGVGNWIVENAFKNNAVGVFLWWDIDEHIASLPWAQANDIRSFNNLLLENTFDGDDIALQLRECEDTFGNNNVMENVGQVIDADAHSLQTLDLKKSKGVGGRPDVNDAPGTNQPIGKRAEFGGRDAIIMTEWGPWDHQSPLLKRLGDDAEGAHRWEVRSNEPITRIHVDGASSGVASTETGTVITVKGTEGAGIARYTIEIDAGETKLSAKAVHGHPEWNVTVFPWTVDPRRNEAGWRAEAQDGPTATIRGVPLRLNYAHGGPSELGLSTAITDAEIAADRFGTIATTTMTIPPGQWRLATRSDDGIRVWIDDALVIDDWTWHAPKTHTHDLTIDKQRTITLRVEHFELDGFAILEVELDAR